MALFEVQRGGGVSFAPHFLNDHLFASCKTIWVGGNPHFSPISEASYQLIVRNHAQDPVNARFNSCALPFISACPSVIAICFLLGFLAKLLPKRVQSPIWSRAFVEEPKEEQDELLPGNKKSFTRLTIVLFVVSAACFALQMLTVFLPVLRMEMVFSVVSWAVGALAIAICRPTTAPLSLLALYVSIFTTQAIILVDSPSSIHVKDLPSIMALISALMAIGAILIMPMRDPQLPKDQISPAFGPPTSDLRSPEDDLTVWQFMTVSWMAPLMSVGNKRQLNDEDVWQLGYEFKHRILHDTFRELKGSVLGRLFRANGLDLVIISCLSIFELVASI